MNQKVSKFLVYLRMCKGNTQSELATYLNISNKTVSKWETGSSLPDTSYVPKIAEYYNVTCDELLNGNYIYKNTACKKTILSIFIIIVTVMYSFSIHFVNFICLINDKLRIFQIIVLASFIINALSSIIGFIFLKHFSHNLKIIYVIYFSISILHSIVFLLEYILISI